MRPPPSLVGAFIWIDYSKTDSASSGRRRKATAPAARRLASVPPRQRRRHPQPDVDRPREEALGAQHPKVPPQPAADRPRRQRVQPVREDGQRHEERAEDEHLPGDRAPLRLDELSEIQGTLLAALQLHVLAVVSVKPPPPPSALNVAPSVENVIVHGVGAGGGGVPLPVQPGTKWPPATTGPASISV